MTETIRLKKSITKSDAEKLFAEVSHGRFHSAIGNLWCSIKTRPVPAYSICWLYCWGKTGMSSDETAAKVREIFDRIFDQTFEWLDARIDHNVARKLRYVKGPEVEGLFAQAISQKE